jgi:hypothetical protein
MSTARLDYRSSSSKASSVSVTGHGSSGRPAGPAGAAGARGERIATRVNFVDSVQALFLLARVREVHGSEAFDRTLAGLTRPALHQVATAAINGWRSLSMPRDS